MPAASERSAGFIASSSTQRHRGPDWSGVHTAGESDCEVINALVGMCETIETFPPGHLLDSADGVIRPYYAPRWREYEALRGHLTEPAVVRWALMRAVRRQLMSDVPYGVLLSGGLDSSVIAWCAQQFARRRVEEDRKSEDWWRQRGQLSDVELAAAAEWFPVGSRSRVPLRRRSHGMRRSRRQRTRVGGRSRGCMRRRSERAEQWSPAEAINRRIDS